MITTPKEFIKWLKENYKADMNQPIAIILDDKSSLREFISNRFDDVFADPSNIPNELLDKCLSNVSDDDRVAEALNDSYDYDVRDFIDRYMQDKDDTELWEK